MLVMVCVRWCEYTSSNLVSLLLCDDAAAALPAPTTPIVNIVHQRDYPDRHRSVRKRRRASD